MFTRRWSAHALFARYCSDNDDNPRNLDGLDDDEEAGWGFGLMGGLEEDFDDDDGERAAGNDSGSGVASGTAAAAAPRRALAIDAAFTQITSWYVVARRVHQYGELIAAGEFDVM